MLEELLKLIEKMLWRKLDFVEIERIKEVLHIK